MLPLSDVTALCPGRRAPAGRRLLVLVLLACVFPVLSHGLRAQDPRLGKGERSPAPAVAGGKHFPGLTARAPTPPVLVVGQTVQAGERARCWRLPRGAMLLVREGSRVKLGAAATVELQKGEICLDVESGPVSIRTADREITCGHGQLDVRLEARGTYVLVLHGRARLAAGGPELGAGMELLSTAVVPRPVADVLSAVAWLRGPLAEAEPPVVPPSRHEGGGLVVAGASGREEGLELRNYHVDVHIEDGFARTTIDQIYFNNQQFVQEGTFYFPLPPDASLSRLAMYVNGVLMEGGMAERVHAEDVFNRIVTALRDPALLEWVDGRLFRMRVFPLEPLQEKRIILSYTQRLPAAAGQVEYRFPAGHTLGTVGHWSFHALVKSGAELAWQCDSHRLTGARHSTDLTLDAAADRTRLDCDLILKLADANAAWDGARFTSMEHDGERYVMVRYRPVLPPPAAHRPHDWVFLVETSAGRDSVLARTQIEVVRGLLARAEPEDTFTILTAAADAEWIAPVRQPVGSDAVRTALARLEKTRPSGALNLGRAFRAAAGLVEKATNPVLVHVGSGVAAVGMRNEDELAQMLPARVRYVGVGVGRRRAESFMQRLADRSGGLVAHVDPTDPVGWECLKLCARIDAPWLRQLAVVEPNERVSFLPFEKAVSAGDEICAVARLAGHQPWPEAVVVTGVVDGRTYRQSLPVRFVSRNAGYLPRTWAKLEIDRLLAENSVENRQQVIELSKMMYVMTPFTSLLVLENEEMYARFGVDRGRKDHWAMYACPARVEVVKASADRSATRRSRDEVLNSILIRTPAPFFVFAPSDQGEARTQVLTASAVNRALGAGPVALGEDLDFVWPQNGLRPQPLGPRNPAGGSGEGANEDVSLLRLRPGGGGLGMAGGLGLAGGGFGIGGAGALGLGGGGLGLAGMPGIGGLGGLSPAGEMPALPLKRSIGGSEADTEAWPGGGPIFGLTTECNWLHVAPVDLLRPGSVGLRPGWFPSLGADALDDVALWPSDTAEVIRPMARVGGMLRQLDATPSRHASTPAQLWQADAFGGARDVARAALARYVFGVGDPPSYRRPLPNGRDRVYRDLLAFAPGMNTTAADVGGVLDDEAIESPDDRVGSVDPVARVLIDRARAAGWQSVRVSDGPSGTSRFITFDGQGRFRWERQLPNLLREVVACDGKWLKHLYPEIGVGAQRRVSRFHRAEFLRLVPWLLPPAEDLARGADVRLIAPRTVAVVPTPGNGRPQVHLVFAPDGRLAERRLVEQRTAKAYWRETYAPDGTVSWFSDQDVAVRRHRYLLVDAAAPDLSVPDRELLLLPLPYRTTQSVRQRFGLDPNDRLRRETIPAEADLPLLAAAFAEASDQAALSVAADFVRSDGWRLGLCTLRLAAGLTEELAGLADRWPDSPLAGYLDRLATADPVVIGRLPGPPHGFLADLAAAHDLSLAWGSGLALSETEAIFNAHKLRLLNFLERTPSPVAAWAVLGTLLEKSRVQEGTGTPTPRVYGRGSAQEGWLWSMEESALQTFVRRFGSVRGLGYAGRCEVARVQVRSGNVNGARDTLFTAYVSALDDGDVPPVDDFFRTVFQRHDGLRPIWAEHLSQVATAWVRDHRRPEVVLLAGHWQWFGESKVADRLLAQALTGRMSDVERLEVRLAMVLYLVRTGQGASLDAALRTLLADPVADDQPAVWRLAAELAGGRGGTARAVRYLERALDLEYAGEVGTLLQSAVWSDHRTLLHGYELLADSYAALEQKPPDDLIGRVVRTADRWRAWGGGEDAREPAARLAGKLGATDLAWSYVLERYQSEPASAGDLRELSNELLDGGNWDLADRALELAAEAEPSNPEFLWGRFMLRQRVGRTEEARHFLKRIVDGSWPLTFDRVREEARQLLRQP